MAGAFMRGPGSFDTGRVFSDWIKGATARHHSENLIINLFFKRLLLVNGRELSAHILEHPPSTQTYLEGPTKTNAMSFLAPQALTICHDQQWQGLRPYNEQTLSIEEPQRQQYLLEQVRQAFSRPVSSIDDIRRNMGRLMLNVVFGKEKAPQHLAEDIQVLFVYVQSPLRRVILGRKERGRRERFYNTLGQLWREQENSQQPRLLSTAQEPASQGSYSEPELLQQIPHWMFTFTGSGTDLLSRTLALVGSRPEVRDKVISEVGEKGSLNEAATIGKLQYLEACLLETCRLFPPVTRTLHIAPQGGVFKSTEVPAGVEIIHCFPVNNRDTALDAAANDFLPERWLGSDNKARSAYPNLFLSGARACPGRELILFICKSAVAVLLKEHNTRVEAASLARDPLPFSFPEREVRFGP
ncbi:MAG TPA: cytochrome P450 [Dehalococcoidia bacterium]|nr:cytochrome P450 [Dehalococcoidia bacterium]